MLFIPIFFIFAALLFETAKVSREKIRHQMGLDAGAYAEVSNMTDYLNRTAYVNATFPFRIFKESWNCSDCPYCRIPYARGGGGGDCLYDIEAHYNSVFPVTQGDKEYSDSESLWKFSYANGRDVNVPNVDLMELNHSKPPPRYTMYHYLYPCDNNQTPQPGPDDDYDCGVKKPYPVYSGWKTYSWYVTVYSTLGAVQEAQKAVYEAIASGSKFLRRGYYLNTGSGYSGGNLAVAATRKNTADTVSYACRQFKDPVCEERYGIFMRCCPKTTGRVPVKLYQSSTISNIAGVSQKMDLRSKWDPPSNFFRVAPSASASVGCSIQVQPAGAGQDMVNLEAGYPTPHYQTRLYPLSVI